MENETLLPCPFCGGVADPREWASRKLASAAIVYGPGCSQCGATAPNFAAWNTRIHNETFRQILDLVSNPNSPTRAYDEARRIEIRNLCKEALKQ